MDNFANDVDSDKVTASSRSTGLQIKEGIKDNSKIIFLISQRKHML